MESSSESVSALLWAVEDFVLLPPGVEEWESKVTFLGELLRELRFTLAKASSQWVDLFLSSATEGEEERAS